MFLAVIRTVALPLLFRLWLLLLLLLLVVTVVTVVIVIVFVVVVVVVVVVSAAVVRHHCCDYCCHYRPRTHHDNLQSATSMTYCYYFLRPCALTP